MTRTDRSAVFRLAQARTRIPGPAGEHAVTVFQRGTLDAALSLPVRPNRQNPHTQDEVYVIVRGRGVLLHDGKRDPFEAGEPERQGMQADHDHTGGGGRQSKIRMDSGGRAVAWWRVVRTRHG